MKNIELEFEEEVLRSIARQAMGRKTDAHGLRSIAERYLLDTVYQLPDPKSVAKVVISKDVIGKDEQPRLLCQDRSEYATKEKAAR